MASGKERRFSNAWNSVNDINLETMLEMQTLRRVQTYMYYLNTHTMYVVNYDFYF